MMRAIGNWILLGCLALAGAFPALAGTAPDRPTHYRPADLILILGAVPQEVPPFVEAMKDAGQRSLWGVPYWQGHIAGKPVVVALTGVGKTKAAMITTLFVTRFHPRLALMSGTGSRTNAALRTGDVIVAASLYEHDLGSLTRQDMVYHGDTAPLLPSPRLLAIADRAIAGYAPPTVSANGASYAIAVRRGVVATGDLFGVTDARIATLRDHFHTDIMEMESAAFARSCETLGVPWLVVRAGSNLTQEAPSDDYKRLGPIAAKQAAYFTLALIPML
jgi:adenosylhomocysteine nucleosidase